jgi:hypothetical protein
LRRAAELQRAQDEPGASFLPGTLATEIFSVTHKAEVTVDLSQGGRGE